MEQTQKKIKRQSFLRDIKTAVTGRIRSKPTAEGQQYLDQYTLRRDRARWSQMKERSEQMIRSIDNALGKIGPLVDTDKGQARDVARTSATISMKTSKKRNTST